jgi:hypothetical protein
MSELKGEKVCRLHRVAISQVHEVSIGSSSPPTAGIRYPQNLRSGKKSASVRLENQEAEPRKRRRSLVNGRTWDRIETCEREENGWMSLVMLLPLLIGGFNGSGYTVLYIRVREKSKEWILPFVNIQLFARVLADFALQESRIKKKSGFSSGWSRMAFE